MLTRVIQRCVIRTWPVLLTETFILMSPVRVVMQDTKYINCFLQRYSLSTCRVLEVRTQHLLWEIKQYRDSTRDFSSGPIRVRALLFRISPKRFRYTMLVWSTFPNNSPIYFILVFVVNVALTYLSSIVYVTSLNNVQVNKLVEGWWKPFLILFALPTEQKAVRTGTNMRQRLSRGDECELNSE